MKDSVAREVIQGLKEAGIDFVSFLPESWMKQLYWLLAEDPAFLAVPCTNEGEGVSLCAGAWLGGRRAAMIMENSGLRVACESLARLGLGHGIPVLLVMSYRGDFGDKDWWAQPHGWTMEPILRALRIPYRILRHPEEIRPALVGAYESLRASKQPVAVVMGAELCL